MTVSRAKFSPSKGFGFAQTLGTSAWLRSQNSWHQETLDQNFLRQLLSLATLIKEKSLLNL